jgi:hypothetical protein
MTFIIDDDFRIDHTSRIIYHLYNIIAEDGAVWGCKYNEELCRPVISLSDRKQMKCGRVTL